MSSYIYKVSRSIGKSFHSGYARREHIISMRKQFLSKWGPTDDKQLILYIDQNLLAEGVSVQEWDSISERCFGMTVRSGQYLEGDSELPPFLLMVEHKGSPDRFVSDTEEICRTA